MMQTFKTWKTITVGNGLKDASDFSRELQANSVLISDRATKTLSSPSFRVAPTETKVNLTLISLEDLESWGFDLDPPSEDDILWRNSVYSIAQIRGLRLCPPEAGPQLRLQYPDQPEGECLFIAMEPLFYTHVFVIAHDEDGLWMESDHIEEIENEENGRLVFILP